MVLKNTSNSRRQNMVVQKILGLIHGEEATARIIQVIQLELVTHILLIMQVLHSLIKRSVPVMALGQTEQILLHSYRGMEVK